MNVPYKIAFFVLIAAYIVLRSYYLEEKDIAKLSKAVLFAARKHINQRRKNKTNDPYINHPLEVMDILTRHAITHIDTLCGAILHDTLEDTETTPTELTELFGETVLSIVQDCSDDKTLDTIVRKRAQIDHAPFISNAAKLVKLADKLANLYSLQSSPPEEWSKERQIGYVQWSFRVCQGLYGVPGAESLDYTVREHFVEVWNITTATDKELDVYYQIMRDDEAQEMLMEKK